MLIFLLALKKAHVNMTEAAKDRAALDIKFDMNDDTALGQRRLIIARDIMAPSKVVDKARVIGDRFCDDFEQALSVYEFSEAQRELVQEWTDIYRLLCDEEALYEMAHVHVKHLSFADEPLWSEHDRVLACESNEAFIVYKVRRDEFMSATGRLLDAIAEKLV